MLHQRRNNESVGERKVDDCEIGYENIRRRVDLAALQIWLGMSVPKIGALGVGSDSRHSAISHFGADRWRLELKS